MKEPINHKLRRFLAALLSLALVLSLLPAGSLTLTASAISLHFAQDGDDYVIYDAEGWDTFCNCLEAPDMWNGFAGETVKLAADLGSQEAPITRMAGSYTDGYSFRGTFDGCGKTLFVEINGDENKTGESVFSYVSGATIKNLKISGSVSGGMHCAALVGMAENGTTNLIENIYCDASVSCSKTHCGGILGHGLNSNTTIRGCVFAGSITGGSNNVGVIYGWGDPEGTHQIVDCYEIGNYTDCGGLNLGHVYQSSVQVTNSYWSYNFNSSQGKLGHTVTPGEDVTLTLSGDENEYDVSGITVYDDNSGLLYGGKVIAGNDDRLYLNLAYTGSGDYDTFAVDAGDLSGTENPYELAMANVDVTVSAAVRTDWQRLQVKINAGGTVKLDQDYTASDGDKYLYVDEDVETTLDLNGYTIDGSAINEAQDDVLVINGTLTLTDSSTEGAGMLKGDGGDDVVYVKSGSFTLNGGTISGDCKYGVVYAERSFTMTGGMIIGESDYCSVYVDDGSFTISGAPVIENGVYLYDGTVITIGDELADVSDFTPIPVKMKNPGVFTDGWGTYMEDADPADYFVSAAEECSITKNDDDELQLNLLPSGPINLGQNTVTLGSAYTFTPEETGKYAFYSVGSIDTVASLYLDDELLGSDDDSGGNGNFRIECGLNAGVTYTVNTSAYSDNNNGKTCLVCVEKLELSEWEALQMMLEAGGTAKLEHDYTAVSGDEYLHLPQDVETTLDLNGHTIDGSAITGDQYEVVYVDGKLTLTDSSTAADGVLKSTGAGGAVIYVSETGSLTVENGTVSAVEIEAVYVEDNGFITVNGGTITGTNDYAVYVDESASFTMNGGTITGTNDYAVYMDEESSFTMNGGTVESNGSEAVNLYRSSFTMTGGSIIGGKKLTTPCMLTTPISR